MMVLYGMMGVGVPTSLVAQDCWMIAPGRTKIGFKVKHLVLFTVEGKFKRIKGCIDSHGPDIDVAGSEAVISVDSIYTGNKNRDEHLLSEDFFHVEESPEIKFVSRSFEETSPGEYLIRGGLTMRGVTRLISLKGKAGKQVLMKNDKIRMPLAVTGTLNRFDYGLKWDGVDAAGQALVGDEVELDLQLMLIKNPTTLAHLNRRHAGHTHVGM
jgi:polyisoprenoid-binding protein YceI